MTKLIAYHKDSKYLAIFESDGELWVGQHDPYLTHQTSEPPYVSLFSCSSIDRGIEKMNSLDPNLMH
jgi:hypothetical protein